MNYSNDLGINCYMLDAGGFFECICYMLCKQVANG